MQKVVKLLEMINDLAISIDPTTYYHLLMKIHWGSMGDQIQLDPDWLRLSLANLLDFIQLNQKLKSKGISQRWNSEI